MATTPSAKVLPSCRWLSLEGRDYGGGKARLAEELAHIDKSVLLGHAERIKGQRVTLSSPFSASRRCVCFELVAEDGSLVIARVRLPSQQQQQQQPQHQDDEAYAARCEMATMELVGQTLPGLGVPRVYAYEGPGSQLAADAGGVYMLLEGFYGNTLRDVEPDIRNLAISTQHHIMAQWASVHAALATLACPQIGSVCSTSSAGVPVVGRLASAAAAARGLGDAGPFATAAAYLRAVGRAAVDGFGPNRRGGDAARTGALVFCDIVSHTALFDDVSPAGFPLCHVRLGMDNILVDEHFDFVAITDWDASHAVPWQAAYDYLPRQEFDRDAYRQKLRAAERRLAAQGRRAAVSCDQVWDSPASRIYACFSRLGREPEADGGLVYDMVRLAFGWTGRDADDYLENITSL